VFIAGIGSYSHFIAGPTLESLSRQKPARCILFE
jgi:hypothetical protein